MPTGRAHAGTLDAVPIRHGGDIAGDCDRPSADIVKRLHGAGAHFVLCDVDKAPIWRRWQLRRPSAKAVLRHLASKEPVGIIPASVSALVLDVDCVTAKDDLIALFSACAGRFMVPSRRPGGSHIYIADDQPRPNGTFDFLGCSGDIRSATGYVILWHSSAWHALDEHMLMPPTGPLPAIPDAVVPKCASPRVPYYADFDLPNGDCGIPLEQIHHSQRNPALFDAVRIWAYPQDRGSDYDGWKARVLNYTRQQNRRLKPSLPDHVLVGMAGRIARYTWKMPESKVRFRASLDPDERVAVARQHGIASGIARRRDTLLEHDRQPLIPPGVSRATRYRWLKREREIEAGAAPKRRPRLVELQPWVRMGISRSAWYERRAKVLAGEVPPRLHSGWGFVGIGESAWWDYLGLSEAEWELVCAPDGPATTAPPGSDTKPDFYETELNRAGVSLVGGLPPHDSLPPLAKDPEWAVRCAADLVYAMCTATPVPEPPSEGLSQAERQALNRDQRKRKQLCKLAEVAQRYGARKAGTFATASRRAFHAVAARNTTAYKREKLREHKESLRLSWLDYLLDCDEERSAAMCRTGIATVSYIAVPTLMPDYDGASQACRRAFAMMMRDVERANLGRAEVLFRQAQQRGEQPTVPPWEKELAKAVYQEVMEEVDRLDTWRPRYGDTPEHALAA